MTILHKKSATLEQRLMIVRLFKHGLNLCHAYRVNTVLHPDQRLKSPDLHF